MGAGLRIFLVVMLRALQLLAMLSVVTGLYVGYVNRDMNFELMTLIRGAAVFYLLMVVQQKWLDR